jgi:predicted MFS family arabinose efflux permease
MSFAIGGDPLRRIRLRVLGVVIVGMLLSGVGSTILVARHQYSELPRVLAAKEVAVAVILGHEIRRAIELGIPMDALRGLGDLLAEARHDHPELGYLLIADAAGHGLASAGRPPSNDAVASLPQTAEGDAAVLTESGGYSNLAVPIASGRQQSIGTVFIGIDTAYIHRLVTDRIFDVVTVLIVTGIGALEVLLLLLDYGMLGPMRSLSDWAAAVVAGVRPRRNLHFGFREFAQLVSDADSAAADTPLPGRAAEEAGIPWQVMVRFIRVALFMFVLGDALSMPFLPLFAREIAEPMFGLSKQFLLSLPVVVYWLASAIVQLFGVWLIDRYPHRRVFLAGAAFSAAGLSYAAIATGIGPLLLARTLSGLGLGLVFMTCQAAIITHVPRQSRTLGVAIFTGTFFLATFCGTALGGIASQQLGFRGAFVLSACIVGAAAAFALTTFGASRERPVDRAARADTGSAYARLTKNPRFASLLLFCAVPNRTFNVALLFYLAPLYLYSIGSSKAEIGRAVSLYAVAMAVLAPAIASFVDRRRWQVGSVVFGSLVCAIGACSVLVSRDYGVTIAIVLMGVGQALSIPSQVSLVPLVAARETLAMGIPRVMSVFRIGERMPAFLGPMAAQVLAGAFGYQSAIASFGVWVGLSAVILATVLRFSGGAMPARET